MNFHLLFAHFLILEGCFGLKLSYIKKCEPRKRYMFDLNTNVSKENFVDGVANMTKPFESPAELKLELSKEGRKFFPLSSWRENNFCESLKNYGGRVFSDVQRTAKITPGECPIKPGVYSVRKFKLDLSLVPQMGLPKGEIKLTVNFPNGAGHSNGCYFIGLSN